MRLFPVLVRRGIEEMFFSPLRPIFISIFLPNPYYCNFIFTILGINVVSAAVNASPLPLGWDVLWRAVKTSSQGEQLLCWFGRWVSCWNPHCQCWAMVGSSCAVGKTRAHSGLQLLSLLGQGSPFYSLFASNVCMFLFSFFDNSVIWSGLLLNSPYLPIYPIPCSFWTLILSLVSYSLSFKRWVEDKCTKVISENQLLPVVDSDLFLYCYIFSSSPIRIRDLLAYHIGQHGIFLALVQLVLPMDFILYYI